MQNDGIIRALSRGLGLGMEAGAAVVGQRSCAANAGRSRTTHMFGSLEEALLHRDEPQRINATLKRGEGTAAGVTSLWAGPPRPRLAVDRRCSRDPRTPWRLVSQRPLFLLTESVGPLLSSSYSAGGGCLHVADQFSDLIAKVTDGGCADKLVVWKAKEVYDAARRATVDACNCRTNSERSDTQVCARIRDLEHSQLRHSLMIKAWHWSKQPTDRLMERCLPSRLDQEFTAIKQLCCSVKVQLQFHGLKRDAMA